MCSCHYHYVQGAFCFLLRPELMRKDFSSILEHLTFYFGLPCMITKDVCWCKHLVAYKVLSEVCSDLTFWCKIPYKKSLVIVLPKQ